MEGFSLAVAMPWEVSGTLLPDATDVGLCLSGTGRLQPGLGDALGSEWLATAGCN
jgi:hypothetical protein